MPVDPLDALQPGDVPVPPSAEFRVALYRRLEAAVRGVDAEAAAGALTPAAAAVDRPAWLYYFTVPTRDLDRARSFYTSLFGWQMEPNPDGSALHVEGVHPPMGVSAMGSDAPQLWFVVPDVRAAVARVRAAGGTSGEPVHYESGWAADCTDDQGTAFSLSEPTYDTAPTGSMQAGELFYFSMPVADPARAEAFFGAVFGWVFDRPGPAGGRHIANSRPDGGLDPTMPGHDPTLFFRVDDLDAAMVRVRELGGTAEFVGEGPEGRHAVCTDDQGVTFGISQPAPGY